MSRQPPIMVKKRKKKPQDLIQSKKIENKICIIVVSLKDLQKKVLL